MAKLRKKKNSGKRTKEELKRKSHLLQVLHLVNHEGVIRKKYIAPDDLEIWEKFAEALKTVYAIQKQVAGDLAQFRKTDVLEIGLGIVLD